MYQVLNFPGGEVKFTPEMKFIPQSSTERIRCYRVLDDNGQPITNRNFVQVVFHFGPLIKKITCISYKPDTELPLWAMHVIRSVRKLL